MNRLTNLFLARRGLDEQSVKHLDDACFDRLMDIDNAVEILHNWKTSNTKVVVLPDFDMDGISSGVLLHAGLCELGFDCELFEPNPQEGYGFVPKTVDRLVRQHPGVGAVITCDVGISCERGAKRIREHGLDLLITDHHVEPEQGSARHLASACVDPCRRDETYPFAHICGASVAWKLLDAYAHAYGSKHDVDQISRLRVFAAIGTISDTMPLLYENRSLVREGLAILRMSWSCGEHWLEGGLDGCPEYINAFAGISAMCNAWQNAGKLRDVDAVDEGFVGFYVAPAFNACKRMNEPMKTAFSVFEGDERDTASARLLQVNAERKELVEQTMDALVSSADEILAPYVYVIDAPVGILGLLASKMLELSGMPTLVLSRKADGKLAGSGRSPSWYPFLQRARDKCGYAAGHEGAFGVSFDNEAQMREFAKWIVVDAQVAFEQAGDEIGGPTADIVVSATTGGDCGLDVPLISEFVNETEAMRPFGRDFEAPRVLLRFNAEDAVWTVIGSEHNHCKCVLPYGVSVLIWGRADLCENGSPSGLFELEGRFEFNEFNQDISLQFVANKVVTCGEVA